MDTVKPMFQQSQDISHHTNWIFGGSLFTPEDTDLRFLDPADRPYAGWLYAGVGLIQDNNSRSLDHIELLADVVGPAAGGRQTQNDFHQFVLRDESYD